MAFCHSFCIYFFLFTRHTFIPSFFHDIRRGPSQCLHSCRLSGGNLLRFFFFFKGLVAGCHSFCLFFIYFFITYIHSIHIHTIHLSIAIRCGLSPSPHRLKAQWEDPPCGAELGIELGPALQQADALPTEPRRTIKEIRTRACLIAS